ncbi:MAG: hypothetical protein N2508_14670 [Anaerolineae bacterium]|nr:hypothetical protein [Anaerolineae bacterium]
MGLQAPPVQRHDTLIVTTEFQFKGQLESIGAVGSFIADTARISFSLYDVHMAPLSPSFPLKSLSRPQIVVLRPHIILLYLTSEEARATVRTFTRREIMMLYTPVAVCRGEFALPAEAKLGDMLGVMPGDLLPMMNVQILPLVKLPMPFPTQAELILVGRSHILCYHPG